MKIFLLSILVGFGVLVSGCQTKADIRRQAELERLKQDVQAAKSTRADLETQVEEMRSDITRLANSLEEQLQVSRKENEELKKELQTVGTRIQALESRAAAEEAAAKAAAESRSKQTYENGKKLYDEERYDDAIEVLKGVIANKPKSDDARRAHLLIADCYFAAKDFASAALEYGEFKKEYPKDSMVPNATYRQAQSFKNLGKKSEARLFYQELIERFPKNNLASKAKSEIKRLK